MIEIILGVGVFTGFVLILVVFILSARSKLVASGNVTITINDKKFIETPIGGKLLGVLGDAKIFISSACGGGGTCGVCRVKVFEGGGAILPTETSHINKREAREGYRLSCQVAVKQNMKIVIPDEVFGVKKWECTVRSNHNVATFIKELVLELPQDEYVDFRAGGYIQIFCPPYEHSFKDFDIEERFRSDWDRLNLWELVSKVNEPLERASRTRHAVELVCISTGLRTHQDVQTIQLLLKSQSKRRKRGAGLLQQSLRLFDFTLRRSPRFVAVLHEF